jgi:CubicO group peptidase (beta-lactamase class C family)
MLDATRSLGLLAAGVFLSILCIQRTEATEPVPPLTADDLETFLDRFIPEQLSTHRIAGAVVVVVQGDEVLVNKGYGFADVERRIPMSESTLVRPASISKLFTTIAVMQWVERGKLDLDRDVNDYLDFHIPTPEGGVPVTLRRLLTHRAGFEGHLKDLFAAGTSPPPLGDWLEASLPPRLFPNGDVSAYSNYGYGLAGYIVERVSGERFEDYVSSHILQPLGMSQSTFTQPLSDVARGYKNATMPALPYFETVTPAPTGGMSTTATDMSRFLQAILSSPTENSIQITSVPTPLLGLEEDYAAGNRFFGKHGLALGSVSEVAWLPAADFGIFVSYNSASALYVPTGLVDALGDRYFKQPSPPLSVPSTLEDTTAFAGAYESTLRSDSSFIRLFGLMTQQMVVKALPGGKIKVGPFSSELQQVEPGLFRATDDLQVRFMKHGSGDFMHINAIPIAMEWERVPLHRDARVVLPVVQTSVSIIAATLLAWPVAAWIRRRRNRPFGNSPRDQRDYRWVRGVLGIHVLVCLIAALLSARLEDLTRFNVTLDPWLVILYICAWLAVVGTAVVAWVAIRFWRDRVGSLWARLHHTLLAVSCSLAAWFLLTWRISGTTLKY